MLMSAVLECRRVTKTFRPPMEPRAGGSQGRGLTVNAGERLAIVGHLAAVSTLLNLIGALDLPTGGQVIVVDKICIAG